MIKWFYAKTFNVVDWLFCAVTLGLYMIVLYAFDMPTWEEQWQANRSRRVLNVDGKKDAGVSKKEKSAAFSGAGKEDLLDREFNADTRSAIQWMRRMKPLVYDRGREEFFDVYKNDLCYRSYHQGKVTDNESDKQAVKNGALRWVSLCREELKDLGIPKYLAYDPNPIIWNPNVIRLINVVCVYYDCTIRLGGDPDFSSTTDFAELKQKYNQVISGYRRLNLPQESNSVVGDYQQHVDDFFRYTETLLQAKASGNLVNSSPA